MEREDDKDQFTTPNKNSTPLPLSDLFVRRSPPEGRLRNVRDSISTRDFAII
jgi:hypothetical protein